MKKRRRKKSKKQLILDFIYNLLLGGKEYETEIQKTSPLPIKTILGTLTVTVLVMVLVFSFIEISSLSSDIGDLKKEFVELTSKEGKLHDDLNHKYPHADLMSAIEAMGFSETGGQTVMLEESETEEEP